MIKIENSIVLKCDRFCQLGANVEENGGLELDKTVRIIISSVG